MHLLIKECIIIIINRRFFMTNLSCNATTCSHNSDKCCCLSGIDIKGEDACSCDETCCTSFEHKENTSSNSCGSPKLNLSIKCAAHNCIYNEDNACHADHVDISGITAVNSDDTVCATFTTK
ncbi:MAG TPA: DUF1540 domain-containing protein [Eubacterium sp.]|jgi:hypothetical protein|nr:DUF1540 domain-containing protein [Eubacterium sp.]